MSNESQSRLEEGRGNRSVNLTKSRSLKDVQTGLKRRREFEHSDCKTINFTTPFLNRPTGKELIDEELACELASVRGGFKPISYKWSDNTRVVVVAVSTDGENLEFASQRLQSDKTVVMAAVKNEGPSLRHASKELRDDKVVVIEAIRQRRTSIFYGTHRASLDMDVIREYLKD